MSDFYHLCFVVQDIERATGDLTRAVGVSWSPVHAGRLGWSASRCRTRSARPGVPAG